MSKFVIGFVLALALSGCASGVTTPAINDRPEMLIVPAQITVRAIYEKAAACQGDGINHNPNGW